MDREQLKEKILSVKNAYKDIQIVYEVLDELGIKYKKTNCKRCRDDLRNIALEELGLIASAADESDFNNIEGGDYKYIYIGGQSVGWMGNVMNQDTPIEVIEDFVKMTGDRYYKKVKVENAPEDINNDN